MLANPRVRATLRRADRSLPQRLRRRIRIVAGRAAELRTAPLVSVVVAARSSDTTALGESLDALRSQEYRNVEILVLLDDLRGPVADLVRRHVEEDWRIHLARTAFADVSTARNHAAASARGRYLCFVCPGDALPPTALNRLVRSMDESGSSFVFGRLSEVGLLRRNVTQIAHPAHEESKRGVSLSDFSAAVTDTFDENRLYRTSFWRSAGLAFQESGPTPSLVAFSTAPTFDVLAETTYHRSTRGVGRPIGSLTSAMADLDEWLTEQEVMQRFLASIDNQGMRDAWALAVCDLEAVPLLDDAERATPEQWQQLRTFLASVREEISDRAWDTVRAESRVKVWFAVNDRRADLEYFVTQRLFEVGNRRTEVVDGVVLARFDSLGGSADDIPADCLAMGERETPLLAHLQAASWTDDNRLRLRLFVRATFVSLAEADLEVTVALRNLETGVTLPQQVTLGADPEANTVAGHRYQDYAPGVVEVEIDPAGLPERTGGEQPDVWGLDITLSTQGLVRSGTVNAREDRGSAGLLAQPFHAPRVVGGQYVGLRGESRRGLSLVASAAPRMLLESCSVEGRTLSGRISGAAGGAVQVVRPDGLSATADLVRADGEGHTFSLTLPDPRKGKDPANRRWAVRVLAEGHDHPVGLAPHLTGRFVEGTTTTKLCVGRDVLGHLEVAEAVRTLILDEVLLETGRIRLRGSWVGTVPKAWQVVLRNRRATFTVNGTGSGAGTDTSAGGTFEAEVSTRWDEWGLGVTRIPLGVYQLEISCPESRRGSDVRVVLSDRFANALMSSTILDGFRMTPLRNARGLAVRLAPALSDDERGPFHQRQMQAWSASAELEIDPGSVYLQSYGGLSATDSQRAIHDELRRTRPDLTIYWAVGSEAMQVPDGGVPVLMNSREWYRVVGTAKYLSNNIDFDRWFLTKPGQRFLQTFHGYPAKSMGIRLWKAKHFTASRIDLELERTSRDWDLILTPTPEMDRYYREEYAYTGEIENAGYPRDDGLLAPDRDEVRERTRRALGITGGQTVVLYAPTWRDDQATNYRTATMTKHLDLETATTHLGEEYVFLMRGHRFHAQGTDRSGRTARLVDVTDYPEINDLILAADAAVLDYSSLRFDFALTGRPMLFLVPDLRSYTGGVRGFLYPFEESAPGPLLNDAEDVVEALRRLPAVAAEHAEAYEQFNRTYNYLQDGKAAERVVARFFD